MKVFAHIDKLRCSVLAIMVVTAFPVFASLPRHRFLNGDTRYTYDALNRLVSRSVPSVPSVDRFSYDAVGNLLTASNETAHLAFSYDALNRLASSETRVAGQVFGVSYAYDLGGLCTNVVYPGGRAVRYGYDADGRVTHVTDWAGRAWAFTRDAAGRLTAASCPNGVTGAWTHDANHAVSGWSYNNGPPFAGRVITRDEAGVKTKEQVTAGLFPNPQNPRRAINTFDAADRLVSATVAQGTNTYAETYLYDLNGALTNKQSAIGNERYEYDCAGRLSYLQLLNPNSSLLLSTEFTYISGALSRTRGQHDRDDRGGKTDRSFVGNQFQAVLYRHPDRAASRMEETAVRQGIDDRRAGMDHRRRSERGHPG